MAVSWGGICCSEPPCVAISVRSSRQTFKNLIANEAFTVNIPPEKYVHETDYAGIYSGKDENKFERLWLTPVHAEIVDAPYVEEFPLNLMCKVIKTIPIGIHIQFIGEILDIKADEEFLSNKGLPEIEKMKPFIYDSASRRYFSVGNPIIKAYTALKR